MKRLLLALLFAFPLLAQHSYRTTFPLAENPISEGGHWANGNQSPALDWTAMQTTPGLAFGTQVNTGDLDDSTALLTGSWNPTQVACMRVHKTGSADQQEVEIRLRSTFGSHTNTGYEIDVSNGFNTIVRWNGALNDFTPLMSTDSSTGAADGDIICGSISGTSPATISSYKNGVLLHTVTDNSPWTTGNPGMGWFNSPSGDPIKSDYGIYEFWAYDTTGTIRFAANCNQAGVAAAITASSAGDVVMVPRGAACSWSGNIAFTGITVVGTGSSATSGSVVTTGTATMTKHATQQTALSGFRFTSTTPHLIVNSGTTPFRFDNNYFNMNAGDFVVTINTNGGLADHNTFDCGSTSSIADVMGIHAGGSEWSAATSFGNADSTGNQNVYFEANTFSHCSVALDGDDGAREVLRYNTMRSSAIVFHGTQPNDTTGNPPGGARQLEVYNNTFSLIDTVNDNVPQGWVWVRGESGIIANNAMTNHNSQQFSNANNNILLTVGCNQAGNTTYPVKFQVGQSAITSAEPENPPSHPLLIFGNTGVGGTVTVAGQGGTGGTFDCSTPANFIQNGRDYMTNNAWSWTPYTYPHPLDTTFTVAAPSPAAQPVFSPAAGNFTSPQTVSISNPSGAPVVCYTTNGTTPATNGTSGCATGTVYSSPITINVITTLQAKAGGSNFLDSALTTGVYNVLLPSPMFDHIAGAYTTSVNPLVISSKTPGATVCYRIGATPAATVAGTCDVGSTAGTVSADGNNQASLVVSSTSTVQALATQAGRSNSAIISNLFTIAAGCADPVISGLTAIPGADGQSATITWTTDVPSDTILAYGYLHAGTLTPLTDAAGVTSHSVTINGLRTATQYTYQLRSRKIVGGIPCGNGYFLWTGEASFTTATATGANLTYGLSVVGPAHVTQGKKMYFKTTLNAKTGAFSSGAIKIVLTGLPANTTVDWADQHIFNISTSAVSTTNPPFTNDTLTINISDCQNSGTNCFEEPFLITTASTPTGVANVTLTATATGTCVTNCVQVVSWPVTVVSSAAPFSGVAMPQVTPSSFPAIPAQATYLSDATTYGLNSCPQDVSGTSATRNTFRRNDNTAFGINMSGNPIALSTTYGSWFYDGLLGNYNVSTMLETTASSGGNWAQCADNQKNWYTKSYVPLIQAGLVFDLLKFSTGAFNDFNVTGDVNSTVQIQADIDHLFAPYHGGSVDVSFNQREVTYAMRNSIHGVALGLNCITVSGQANCFNVTSTTMRDFMFEHELGQVDQICLSRNADFYEFFMMGLMAEDLIEYYDLVNKDTRIPPAIACLADWMYTNHWQSTQGGTFPYDVPSEMLSFTKADTGSCLPTLNNMIAPMYAWLYRYSNDPKWQTYGDEVFFSGTTFRNCAPDGAPNIMGFPGDSGGKNYSQNYHWPKYLEWRAAPAFKVFPGSVGFFNIPVSTQSGARTVTLSNPTTSTVNISSGAVTLTGTGYAITGGTCGTNGVAPYALAAANWLTPSTCTVQLKLTAGATQGATYAGTFTINGIPISLYGTGNSGTVATPTITPSASGNYPAGTPFLISSPTAGATLCISDANDDGLAGSFNTPFGSGANAGGTCPYGHAYPNPTTLTASTVGTQYIRAVATKANMEDSMGALAHPTITASTAPIVSLSQTSLAFTTNRTVTSAPQTVTLTNTGTANLTISQISISGFFAQSNNCPASLAPAAFCTFTITFTPASTGSFNGTLTINDNAAGSPHTVGLSGTGTAPVISLLPATYSFGNIATSTNALSSAFTLQNTGNGPLAVNLSIGGAQPTFFGIFSTNCPSVLAAGSSCTLTVRFSPLTAISYAATLVETDPVATGSPTSNALTGVGVTPPTSVMAPLPWILL